MALNNHLLLLFLIEILLISQIYGRCSMTQDEGENTIPRPALSNESEPIWIHGNDSYCQDFVDQPTCCTNFQLSQIVKNFQAIESIFGGSGGCDVCVVNLKRFWCQFTCSPNQADFIEVGNLTNYTIDGDVKTLRDITYYINDDTNCELFQSCKKTKFVAQVPSMGNAIGFTNFQGINAYTKILVYILMKIDNERGLKYDIDKCDIDVIDGNIRGYTNNTECSCNSCDGRCDYNIDASVSFMNGVNVWLIVGCYIFVLVATLGLFFYKKSTEKSDKSEVGRPSEIRMSELERDM